MLLHCKTVVRPSRVLMHEEFGSSVVESEVPHGAPGPGTRHRLARRPRAPPWGGE